MATSVITQKFRQNLVEYFVNGTTIPRQMRIAVGSGGHQGTQARDFPDTNNRLFTQTGIKNAQSVVKAADNSVQYSADFVASELSGTVISEAALVDSSGNVVCANTFAPKNLESGETYTIIMRVIF